MSDLKYLYRVLYILINCFFKQNCWYFFSKAYYQKSYRYILIIENSSVVTVAEWLDGKFWKPKKPAVVQYPKVPKYVYHVFKPKTVKGLSSFIQEQKNKL